MTGQKLMGQKNPNPQGKGVIPVLRDWATMQTGVLAPKSPADFLRDYCISSLVLSADFRFKPVIGNTYFLYSTGQGWNLSLIAPGEWGGRRPGDFLASCRLRTDMTWEMDTSDLEDDSDAVARARHFILGFVESLKGNVSIRSNLPFYVSRLPYYQRMQATALASSLEKSLPPGGDDMKALLGALPARALLSHGQSS